MSEHAVVWKESSEPHRLFRGAFSVADDRVRLRGTDGHCSVVHDLAREDISVAVRVRGEERINSCPSLRLHLATGQSFLIGSLVPIGVLLEVLDAIA